MQSTFYITFTETERFKIKNGLRRQATDRIARTGNPPGRVVKKKAEPLRRTRDHGSAED
jgi:hypothetical protein